MVFDMDITGIDITLLMTGFGAIAKSLHSDRKTDAAKKSVEERMAVIENDIRHHDKRLDDGDSNFKVLDQKIDGLRQTFDSRFGGLSDSVNQLIGEIRAGKNK